MIELDTMTAEEYRSYMRNGKLPARITERTIERFVDELEIVVETTLPRELSPNWSPRGTAVAWPIRKKHADAVAAAFEAAVRGTRITQVRCPVRIHWQVFLPRRGHKQDRNNILGGGLKRLQDELVKRQIITDDNPDVVLDATLEQIPFAEHQGEPRVVIRIVSDAIQSR